MVGKFFTWVDVESHLADAAVGQAWPEWLSEVDAWWDGLELTVLPGTGDDDVREWLDLQFGLGSVVTGDDGLELTLDRPPGRTPETLPVRLTETGGPDAAGQAAAARRPRLTERRVTSALAEHLPPPASSCLTGRRQLIAFHSFKGGVGRTLHAVALADLLASRGQHVLLVDADLEAPGITWMYQAQGHRCDIAYEDVLALLHSTPHGDPAEAVAVAAGYLPSQSVSHYPGTGRITVLPSTRRTRLGPPRISPADLLTEDRSPYFLTEALTALAVAAGADSVVMDLRAGASELSAPVLLDPRVTRIFVTTISSQSLQGTDSLIRQLGLQAPATAVTDPTPGAIITQYRLDAHHRHAQDARDQLAEALAVAIGPDLPDEESEIDEQLLTQPLLSPFREELLALPQGWDEVIDVIRRCGLPELLNEFAPSPVTTGPSTGEAGSLDERRRRLEETVRPLVFAERQGMDAGLGFLTTEPLRRLITDHSTDLPVAVVVGAKGAGKTFTFARMCAAGSWEAFAETNGQHVERAAAVIPVLDPVNLAEPSSATSSPQDLRDRAAGGEGATADTIRDRLNQALRSPRADDPEFWRSTWLDCLASAAGSPGDRPAEDFLLLRSLDPSAACVFLLDGLEDWLETVDDEPRRVALRTLLLEVPAWLRRLRNRGIGLVVFVRRDLARTAIRQNQGQFFDRYAPYELRWDTEDALRLALWLALKGKAVPEPVTPVSDLGIDQIARSLIPLWGAKLGSDASREASTQRWVPAALADFNAQIQARDVVRFVCEAARASVGDDRWPDRVLTPAAMRRALVDCSEAKVEEIDQENPRLGKLLRHMGTRSDVVLMPFDADELDLKADDVEALTQWGALTRNVDGLYRMPEIYRHALGFRTKGRARVIR